MPLLDDERRAVPIAFCNAAPTFTLTSSRIVAAFKSEDRRLFAYRALTCALRETFGERADWPFSVGLGFLPGSRFILDLRARVAGWTNIDGDDPCAMRRFRFSAYG